MQSRKKAVTKYLLYGGEWYLDGHEKFCHDFWGYEKESDAFYRAIKVLS